MRTHTETHTDHGKVREPGGRAMTSPDFDLCGWNSQSPGPRCLLGSWKFTLSPSLSFQFLAHSLALLTLRLLRRLTDNQGRREEEKNRGMRDGGGGGWGRGTCDVPTQGYLIPSVRGERLSCSVWLWQIKEAVQILARSLALSSWVDLTHTHTHMRTHIQCTQVLWRLA